jgi:hypothetical protein
LENFRGYDSPVGFDTGIAEFGISTTAPYRHVFDGADTPGFA